MRNFIRLRTNVKFHLHISQSCQPHGPYEISALLGVAMNWCITGVELGSAGTLSRLPVSDGDWESTALVHVLRLEASLKALVKADQSSKRTITDPFLARAIR